MANWSSSKGTSMYYIMTKRGNGLSKNDNILLNSVLKVITKGRGQKTQNLDYIIHGWSLSGDRVSGDSVSGDPVSGNCLSGEPSVYLKAMKSSPLLGPFFGSEFWGFSLLKI